MRLPGAYFLVGLLRFPTLHLFMVTGLLQLPDELLEHIATELSDSDLGRLRMLNKTLRGVVDQVLHTRMHRLYGLPQTLNATVFTQQYFQAYNQIYLNLYRHEAPKALRLNQALLIKAVKSKNFGAIVILLDFVNQLGDVMIDDVPIMLYALQTDAAVFDLLLKKAEDAKEACMRARFVKLWRKGEKANFGVSAVAYAIEHHKNQQLKAMLDIKGMIDKPGILIQTPAGVEAPDLLLCIPYIYLAARFRNFEAARMLLEGGVDATKKYEIYTLISNRYLRYKLSPIYQAAKNGDVKLVQLLVDKHVPDIPVVSTYKRGDIVKRSSPVRYVGAMLAGSVIGLLSSGVSISATISALGFDDVVYVEHSALQKAVKDDNLGIAKALLKNNHSFHLSYLTKRLGRPFTLFEEASPPMHAVLDVAMLLRTVTNELHSANYYRRDFMGYYQEHIKPALVSIRYLNAYVEYLKEILEQGMHTLTANQRELLQQLPECQLKP